MAVISFFSFCFERIQREDYLSGGGKIFVHFERLSIICHKEYQNHAIPHAVWIEVEMCLNLHKLLSIEIIQIWLICTFCYLTTRSIFFFFFFVSSRSCNDFKLCLVMKLSNVSLVLVHYIVVQITLWLLKWFGPLKVFERLWP